MILFPAIDLFEGKAVRLYQGDYAQMTVYSDNPVEFARKFKEAGAEAIHLVDLEGARAGKVCNLELICAMKEQTGLFCEIGGGIRSFETIKTYLDAGLDRVILGTAATENEALLYQALSVYGERIAVGVDIRDGFVAVKGWTEQSAWSADEFCQKLQEKGVTTIICTDISKDGAMAGVNLPLYQHLAQDFSLQVTASGGVSTLEDIAALAKLDLYGAIIGKAYYSGALDLKEALAAAKGKGE